MYVIVNISNKDSTYLLNNSLTKLCNLLSGARLQESDIRYSTYEMHKQRPIGGRQKTLAVE